VYIGLDDELVALFAAGVLGVVHRQVGLDEEVFAGQPALAVEERRADRPPGGAYAPGAGGFSGPLGSSAAERAAAVFSSLTAAQISSR
jgi:hypothetical protein